MTAKKLWSPSTTENTLNLFLEYIADKGNFTSYSDLHKWSIKHKEVFWEKFWSPEQYFHDFMIFSLSHSIFRILAIFSHFHNILTISQRTKLIKNKAFDLGLKTKLLI